MGRDLIAASPVFRASLEACAAVLTPLGIDLLGAYEADNGFDEPRTAAVGLASLQVLPSSNLLCLCGDLAAVQYARKAVQSPP